MDRTIASITKIYLEEKSPLARFRRALRRSDQEAFDDLFEATHQHLTAAAETSNALPMEIFLLSALIEEHKEVMHLRNLVEKAPLEPPQHG